MFWWLVEGKFGKRQESLAPRLFQRVEEGAELCSNSSTEDQCNEATWSMDAPGWALSMGVTAVREREREKTSWLLQLGARAGEKRTLMFCVQ